jgi:hypothetical protein
MVDQSLWPRPCQEFHRDWTAWKKESDLLDFTDLIEIVAVQKIPPPLPSAVYFVDEAQDHTPLELAVVRQWGLGMKHWVLAGDDQQAIYGFRGASPEAFLDPPLPPEQVTILNKSYRLRRKVKEAADWQGQRISRYQEKIFDPYEDGGEVILASELDYRSGYSVVKAAQEEVEQGRDVMILASAGYFLHPTIAELRDLKVLFHNPYRTAHGGWNPRRGGCERMESFLKDRDKQTWSDVWRWLEPLKQDGFVQRGAKKLVEEVAKDPDTADLLARGEFFELTGAAFPEPDIGWYSSHLLATWGERFAYSLGLIKGSGVSALTSRPSITIGTIHSVKGGETDTVILFPDVSRAAYVELTSDNKKARIENMDANSRLFYVGMTRARHKVILTGGKGAWWGQLVKAGLATKAVKPALLL